MLVLLLIFASLWSYFASAQPEDKKPILGLTSTLPLRWGEGGISDIGSLSNNPLPAYLRLSKKYQVKLIDEVTRPSMRKYSRVLMAQPRSFAPSEFAALDEWVRAGGYLVVLSDPALQWESVYPLGDKRRPLFTSLFSPIFSHWGLEMVLLMETSTNGENVIELENQSIRTVTVGAWQPLPKSTAICTIKNNAVLADCKIGKGRAVLLADADMLNEEYWQGSGIRALMGNDDFGNIEWLMGALDHGAIQKNASN
jgi:hypothetical protein